MKLKTALLAFALVAPVLAHADVIGPNGWLHFEGDLGESHYTGSGSGTYYEDGARYVHTLNFNAPAFELGVTGSVFARPTFGVDWHADYVHLGYESFDGLVNSSDANFNPSNKSGCNGACDPTMRMWGGGSVSGISLPITPYYTWRGVKVSALVGPFIYRPTMSLSYVMPGGSTVYGAQAPDAIRIGLVYGAQVEYKSVFVRYEHFTDRSQGSATPGIQTSTDLLSVGYQW